MKIFIGVKMVSAKEMTRADYNILRGWELPDDENGDDPGYLKDDGKGHIQWDPKDVFEKNNVLVVGDDNKVHPQDVKNMISKVEVSTVTPHGTESKTTLVQCVLVNGFIITESSACVDPANYDEQIGLNICMEKIKDKIWFLMGFLMQSAVYGFQPEAVGEILEPEERTIHGVEECLCPGCHDCKCDVKPIRHVVDALNRMDSPLKEFINITNIEDVPGVTPQAVFTIQSDPISEVGVNGCQAQDIIEYALCLIQSFNARFPCRENALTITKLEEALFWQEARTKKRVKAGVEGFNKSVPAEG